MSIVICELPKAGLGNQLFPLMKAAIFARLNGLPLIVLGYNRVKIGPYLRREKSKRNYRGYFKFEKGVFGEAWDRLILMKYKGYETIAEPSVERLDEVSLRKKKFIFTQIPHWSDYFAGLREHRSLVLDLFHDMVHSDIKKELNKLQPPCIGVHVRMGDFRKLEEGEDFSKVGHVRTPEDYFVNIIKEVRRINGRRLHVSVFTNGYKNEFEQLFSLPDVDIVEGNPDIVDLLCLAKSKFIVASGGSTFSSWAGFLSNAPLIVHPDHTHAPIRPKGVTPPLFEGPFNPADEVLLEESIKRIN